MADIDNYLSSSIDDYLLSIAEGIRLAQGRLDQLQTAQGGSTWSYYLPKLEFELKMTVEMVENKRVSAKLGSDRLRPLDDRHLMLRPIDPSPSSQSQVSVEAASVIRGTFVAVPANAGRPGLILRSRVARIDSRHAEFSLEIIDTAGARQAGVEVHFNIDRELSRQASAAKGLDVDVAAGTFLAEGVVPTDAEGRAATTLELDVGEPVGRVIVISLDVGNRSELVHYEVEA
jgi:hypothetical protein